MRKIVFLVVAALIGLGLSELEARQNDIQVMPVSGNIWMLVGAGANIAVSIGRDGVLLVDAGTEQMADRVIDVVNRISRALSASPMPVTPCVGVRCREFQSPWGWASPAINEIITSPAAPQPIRYVINTSIDPDHVGGNTKIVRAGVTYTGGNLANSGAVPTGAGLISHENVLTRMAETLPGDELPTETYRLSTFKLSHFFNGEGVQMFHVPNAHTDGDSLVYFRYSDVIAAGDIMSTETYPVIDLEKGGNIQGIIDGLNKILEIGIPEFRTQGGTMVIPGHGRLSDIADVTYYRDMLWTVRDRIQDAIGRGLTLQQVKDAKLTMDFDGRWGATSGRWTTDMFIEAVYRNLTERN
jgi:glyoxylase-like metal-dependent hydrolase (beta-lactamase superfamily II)